MTRKKLGRSYGRKNKTTPYTTGKMSGSDKRHIGYFDLPYGVWTSKTGREVLFNRRYKALWWRDPDGPAIRTKVEHFTEIFPGETYDEEWFIESDGKSPTLKAAYWTRSEKILMSFITGRSVRIYLYSGRPGSVENMRNTGQPEDLV